MLEHAQKERLWRRIFRVGVLMLAALLSSVMLEALFVVSSYPERKTAVISNMHLRAEAAAVEIGAYIAAITSQVGWTTYIPSPATTPEEGRFNARQGEFDALRLRRQVPAITGLTFLDERGNERLTPGAMPPNPLDPNRSHDPVFTEAIAHKVYYGPVYFNDFRGEPYMKLSVAGTRRDAGVSVAEVSLKFIWEVVSQIEVGQHGEAYLRGQAYLIDAQGRLIAHPDLGLVLANTDMTQLPQVAAARAAVSARASASSDSRMERVQPAKDVSGRLVFTAYAPLAPLGWLLFVEQPVVEAYMPLYSMIERSFGPLLAGLTLAFFGIAWLSGRSRRSVSRRVAEPAEVTQ